jgi:two-component system, NtrC family, sensor histidine kinase HydH
MTKPDSDGVACDCGRRHDDGAMTAASLELLSSAGVAMAGSFDIRDILKQTHRAAARILGGPPVDVLYAGRSSIHSRSVWFPSDPAAGNLSISERERIAAALSEGATGTATATAKATVEALLAREISGSGRGAIPLRYQEDLLGVLLFESPNGIEENDVRPKLLSILAQHTATALRNIHLTQERIHFERLSAIGRMIGTIVHDFRSPLTALRGYAGMVSKLELAEAERRQYGQWMMDECDRLNHMVAELLEFTRGGRPELGLEWVPVADFLASFAERLARHHRERGIEVAIVASCPGEVRIDRPRFERALWNVATNACQSMPGGGRVKLGSLRRGDELLIEVQDEGCGIPAEIGHRLFEPFFSYGKSEGIGLGMATALKIVEEHGGSIQIESGPQGGTTVRFRLPVSGPEEIRERVAERDRGHTVTRG